MFFFFLFFVCAHWLSALILYRCHCHHIFNFFLLRSLHIGRVFRYFRVMHWNIFDFLLLHCEHCKSCISNEQHAIPPPLVSHRIDWNAISHTSDWMMSISACLVLWRTLRHCINQQLSWLNPHLILSPSIYKIRDNCKCFGAKLSQLFWPIKFAYLTFC